jgi:two-component system nitrate/nitrite response regulator NarP
MNNEGSDAELTINNNGRVHIVDRSDQKSRRKDGAPPDSADRASAVRLVIADDHPIFRSGISALFEETAYEIVGSFHGGNQVLEALPRLKPDCLIVDVQMPDGDGIEVLRTLKAIGSPTRVILLTSSITDGQALEAVRLGVDGLVLKKSAPDLLLHALDSVLAGQQWLDPEMMRRALSVAIDSNVATPVSKLTNREKEIMRLVAQGLRNKEIARLTRISEGTVKMHLHNIYDKLGVGSRTELAMLAKDRGLT